MGWRPGDRPAFRPAFRGEGAGGKIINDTGIRTPNGGVMVLVVSVLAAFALADFALAAWKKGTTAGPLAFGTPGQQRGRRAEAQ